MTSRPGSYIRIPVISRLRCECSSTSWRRKFIVKAKLSDLSVEQPTEIELRTAKALSLAFPDTLIAHADRVVE
jgi:hypothetical protein